VVAPVFQPWYVLWVLPLFVIVGAWRSWFSPLLYLVVAVLIVAGVVDQVAVAHWIPILPLRIFTAALGLAGIAAVVVADREARGALARGTRACRGVTPGPRRCAARNTATGAAYRLARCRCTAPQEGLEAPTYGFEGRCSSELGC